MEAHQNAERQPGVTRFMDERQLAAMTGLKAKTLRRWRVFGRGPRFHKLGGAVRYEIRDVEAWLAACPVGGGEAE